MTNRFESIRFPKKLDHSIRPQLRVCMQYLTVDATAAGTKTGKMSVKTLICPSRPPTFHYSTVECSPDELNRFESFRIDFLV